MNNLDCTPHSIECKCFSWKPIIAGALTAIGLTFLLNLFSIAINLTAFTTNDQGIENLVLGGLIATALGTVASMFASGWLAGYLGTRYCTKRHLGAFYGFLTWCVALIIAIFLSSHAQEYVNFYTHFISGSTISMSANTGAQLSFSSQPAVVSHYVIFILFFLSAFACSLGGHCGMSYICKKECVNKN